MGVCWSLAVEEQFYLLFPMAVRLFSCRGLLSLVAVCIVGAPLLRVALILRGLKFEQVYPLLPTRMDALALGVLAAIIMRNEAAKRWIIRNSRWCYASLFACLALFPSMLKWTTFSFLGTAGYSLLAWTYFQLLLLLLLCPLPAMLGFFRSRWLRWLGGVSYCVYLIHEPIRYSAYWLFGFTPPLIEGVGSGMVTILALAVTLGVAQLSWMFLEKPLIARGHLKYHY